MKTKAKVSSQMHERRRIEVARAIPILLTIIVILTGFPSITLSQTHAGAIIGKMLDEEGNPLPESFIYLTSPAMLGMRRYITSDTGNFIFPGLPPGYYEIMAEKPEYKTVRIDRIIVSVGKTIYLSIVLESSSIEEKITREIPSPALDITSAKTSMSMDNDLLRHIPFPRNLSDILGSMPGAFIERVDFQKRLFIHGQTEKANTFVLDGITVNDPSDQQPFFTLNIDTIEEIEFETSGHPVEAGQTSGGFINLIQETGGNKIDGELLLYYTGEKLSSPLRPEDKLEGPGTSPPPWDLRLGDVSFSWGGLIFKDSFWFFGNARFISQKRTTSFIPWADPLGIDHEEFNRTNEERMGFFKLTGNPIQSLKATGWFNYSDRYRSVFESSAGWNIPEESTRHMDRESGYTLGGNLSYSINQNTFAYAKGGYAHYTRPLLLNDVGRNKPHYFDTGTEHIWGSKGFNEKRTQNRFNVVAFITHFNDRFLGGNHEFKAGAEYEYTFRDSVAWKNDNLSVDYYYGAPNYFGQDVSPASGFLVNKGNVSFSIAGYALTNANPQYIRRRYSLFLQDSAIYWSRLSINLGLRFDWTEAQLNAHSKSPSGNYVSYSIGENVLRPLFDTSPYDSVTVALWKNMVTWYALSPRIGLSFDIFGNGKSLFKGSFSRYTEPLLLDTLAYANPLNSSRSHQFIWFDEDMNDEVDASDTYVPYPDDYRFYTSDYYKRGVASQTNAPYTDEFTVGLHQEIFQDFSIHVNYIHKTEKNKLAFALYEPDMDRYWYTIDQDTENWWVPFETIVPGTDGYPDARFIVYFRSNSAPLYFSRLDNVPELKAKYQALEIAFKKRMSHNWQLNGSLVFGKSTGNTWSHTNRNSEFMPLTISPNSFVNLPEDSSVAFDVPLSFKLMGTYKFPLKFFMSFYFRYMSGIPWARSATIFPPSSWAQANNTDSTPVTVLLEKPGERRTGPYQALDLRIEKQFRVGRGGSLNLSADIMNVFGRTYDFTLQNDGGFWYPDDVNTDQGTRILSSTYQSITNLYGTRSFRISLRFNF